MSTRRVRQPPGPMRKKLRVVLVAIAGLLLACFLLLAGISAAPVPSAELSHRAVASAELWSHDGVPLAIRPNSMGDRCAWRSAASFDPIIEQVFIQAEDSRFRTHAGVDWSALARSAKRGGAGASTITMQVARLIHPHPRTLLGKLQEMLLAVRLERSLTKDEILEQYLNRVPLGRNIRGVEVAAWMYFGHSARRLSLSEAALLAALAPAPSRLDPRFARDDALAARNRLLARLAARGRWNAIEVASARESALLQPPGLPRLAEHLVASIVLPPGQKANVFLSAELQSRVEAIAASHRARLAVLDVTAVAIVVLEHKSSAAVAWVGSLDFGSPASGQVDHARSKRQAGSTLKPFLYAMRLEDGATPDTVVPDFLRGFRHNDDLFVPRNCDESFRGLVTLRVALGSSLNVPAVATAELVGLERLRAKLEEVGLQLDGDASRHGLGLALGVSEVRLSALTNAFSVFARDGMWHRTRILEDDRTLQHRVFSTSTARSIFEILADESARRTGFGDRAALGLRSPVALKTGTSSYSRDFWALGSTTDFTVGVWAGNSDGSPAADLVSMDVAVPVLLDVLLALPKTESGLQ